MATRSSTYKRFNLATGGWDTHYFKTRLSDIIGIEEKQDVIKKGTVETAIGTVAKTVTISGYTPTTGDLLFITFTNGNTANSPTLNINGTGAKNIRLGNRNVTGGSGTGSMHLASGAGVLLYFDGTYYILTGNQDQTDATFSTMSVAEGIAGTATSSRVMRSDYLKAIILNHSPAGARPASDVPSWAKETNKPTYITSDVEPTTNRQYLSPTGATALSKIVTNGDGTTFLSSDGTYKSAGGGGGNDWTLLGSRTANGAISFTAENYTELKVICFPTTIPAVPTTDITYIGDEKVFSVSKIFRRSVGSGFPPPSVNSGVKLSVRKDDTDYEIRFFRGKAISQVPTLEGMPTSNVFTFEVYGR